MEFDWFLGLQKVQNKRKKNCLIKNLLRNFCCWVCLLSSDAIIYLTVSEVKNPVCISRFIFYIIPLHFPNSFVNYCGYFGYFSHYMCIYIYTCTHTYTHTQRSSVPKFTCHIWYHWAGFSLWSLQRKKQMNGDYLNSINNEFSLSSWSSYLWWIWFQRLSEPDAPNYQGKSQFCQRIAPDVLAETSFYTSAIHLQLLFAYAVSIFNLLNEAFHFIQA